MVLQLLDKGQHHLHEFILNDLNTLYTIKSLYNTSHYNTNLDITQLCFGSKVFAMEFYKVIIGKNHEMGIFL